MKKQRRYFVKTQSGLNKEKLYLDYDIYPTDIQKLRFEKCIQKIYTTIESVSKI